MAGQTRVCGHDSEVVVTGSFGSVYEFRDGKAVRVQVCGSRAEALEAAGVRE